MKKSTKKHILVYFLAIMLIVSLFAVAQFYVRQTRQRIQKTQEEAATQSQTEAETLLTKVKVVEILPVPFTDILVLPGTVVPYEDIDLAAKTSGTVEWIGPKQGARLKKDEKLLQVDVTSSKTKVTEARALYEQALKDYNRIKRLYNEKITSKEQLDNAETVLNTSKAALDSTSVNLKDGTLYSPINGILDNLLVDPGEYINPGQTVMKIVDIDRVYIELPVPEKDILYFTKGQEVALQMSVAGGRENNNETSGTSDFRQGDFNGVIDFVSMTADNTTRTYLVKVLAENSEHKMRPGMIVRARLVRRELQDAIAVPFFTIIDHEKGKSVFVIDEEGVARERPIQYGSFQRGLVEIRNGLKLGDKLVVVGQRSLVEGQKVEITGDITPLARQWILEGRDLSKLTVDILQ
ncbi:efflux transporter, RND family, MFP subunit [Candidatus Vecturithrix granuli]|uniref:Efflux transporter, RND family, MFP subunit n=1 Tax=Vecturithrix granuli TaxID=1499967 RepID=A0A081BTT5_VECG1|nr:efflux transporter, RND family, MFP subunit [Candidatus Vecturithrix granuli]